MIIDFIALGIVIYITYAIAVDFLREKDRKIWKFLLAMVAAIAIIVVIIAVIIAELVRNGLIPHPRHWFLQNSIGF